jgi:hypothetical protein
MPGRATALARVVAINVLILAGILILIEGSASWFLFARDVIVLPWVAEPYTRYDPDLGWVNKPNVSLENMFGTGASLKTNSQGFRNAIDTTPTVAPGRIRVICSGDSFTFGDGVDNDHTWCGQLAVRDPRIEAVNLGEGGYGADQAYLRYLRDGQRLEHQVHVFGFIADDFLRMEEPVFLGFGKPILTIEGGDLVTRNVPVPSLAARHPAVIAIPRALATTRVGELVSRLRKKYIIPPAQSTERQAAHHERTRATIRLMLSKLKRAAETHHATLLLLFEPVIFDLDTGRPNPWMTFVEESAREMKIPLVNVLDDMRARSDAKTMFLENGSAAGHYSNAGHSLAADALYARMRELPPLK